ncbi:SGNH/GDSL hydrolase family protein [Candidatus Omnitrophota bacterium]
MRETVKNLSLLIVTIFIFSAVTEVAIRAIGEYDHDGNFFFLKRQLLPRYIPVRQFAKKAERYRKAKNSYIKSDDDLGWTLRPNSSNSDGSYCYNRHGIRTDSVDRVIDLSPAEGTLRIAIFGDSFSHGSGVPLDQTWGNYLEQSLRSRGINAEVLNFAVGGYGMDQAYLRWKRDGHRFSPHIVLFGFQAENTKRNLNIIRPIYRIDTGLPFSKPRFIIEKNRLKLINAPAVSDDGLSRIIKDPGSWSLAKHEYWLKHNGYDQKLLLKSRVISLFIYAVKRLHIRVYQERDFFSPKDEPAQLALMIIKKFKADVESTGSKFYITQIIRDRDLIALKDGRELGYNLLLEDIKKFNQVISPDKSFLNELTNMSVSELIPCHYSPRANEITGDLIAEFINERMGT